LLLSLMLSLRSTCGWLMRSSHADWFLGHSTCYSVVCCFGSRGSQFFWLALLMPCWLPTLFVSCESKRDRICPYLNLMAAFWYFVLICLHGESSWHLTTKVVVTAGTSAMLALIWIASRRGLYIFSVPLAFAIASGTLWLLVAFP